MNNGKMINEVRLKGKVYQFQERFTKSQRRMIIFNLSFYQGKDMQDNPSYGTIEVKTMSEVIELSEKDLVKVQGYMRQDSWEDKNTGQKRYKIFLFASEIEKVAGHFQTNYSQENSTSKDVAPF